MSRPAAFSLFNAFACAIRGIYLLTKGRNGRLQLLAAAVAITLGGWLHLHAGEWVAIVLAIALVLSLETINTALERAVDLASPGWNALARDAKDLAAGAVLIGSIGSAVVGLIVFVPRIIAFVQLR